MITTIDSTRLPYGSESSWKYYSYELDSIGRVKFRRKRESILGRLEDHYSEKVRYYYDSINRIVKERYTFFETVDGSERFPNGNGARYFERFFYAFQEMRITYEYNEKNLVSKATVYKYTDKLFEQNYYYDDKGNLETSDYIVYDGPGTDFENGQVSFENIINMET